MKSKMKRRMLAIVLCMVIALSNSSFIFASSGTEEPAAVAQEGDPQNVQETQTEAAVQDTPAVLSETTPEATPEATPEPTQVPEVTAAPTEAPQATAEPTQAPEVTAAPEATPVPTEAPAVTAEPTQAPEVTVAPETTPEATPVPTEAPVTYNEAVELRHEFKDENGNVTATVTAQIPAGAFQADASELTMEVTVPDQATTEHVKKLMEESLPEHYMLGDTVLYDIRFKVNGTETESQQPIVITFENQNGITVKDVKKAVVFQLDPADPAVEGGKDELVTITQRNDMIESLQNSGQSTDNVDDYDLSEITLKEDGTSNKIQMEGRTSTIYGCYAYYEPVQVLTYEDDQVTVIVSAAENGVIPANAELKVVPITEDKETEDQYKDVEKKLQEKAEEEEYEIAGFLAYDITFVDPDGNETEPNGEVKVSIDYNEAAIPESISEEDAQNAEVSVLHLEEDEDGEVKEVVDMAQNEQVDVLAMTEENKVEKAEVRTESFSSFVIQWEYAYWDRANIFYVDKNGIEIDIQGAKRGQLNLSNGKNAIFEDYKGQSSYEYLGAHLDSVSGQKVWSVKRDSEGNWTYKEEEGGSDKAWISNTRNIYLVYNYESQTNEDINKIRFSYVPANKISDATWNEYKDGNHYTMNYTIVLLDKNGNPVNTGSGSQSGVSLNGYLDEYIKWLNSHGRQQEAEAISYPSEKIFDTNHLNISAATVSSMGINIPGFTFENGYAYFYWSAHWGGDKTRVTDISNMGRVSDRYNAWYNYLGYKCYLWPQGQAEPNDKFYSPTVDYNDDELNGIDTDNYLAYQPDGVLRLVFRQVDMQMAYNSNFVDAYNTSNPQLVEQIAMNMSWDGSKYYGTLARITEKEPVRSGMKFVGWYDNVDAEGNGSGNKIEEVDDDPTRYYKDKTYYAKWQPAVKLSFVKEDIDTKEAIPGAEFTLYENSTDNEGIGVAESNSEGQVEFQTDLYPGKTYYLVETKAPSGYLLSNDIYTVVVTESGGATTAVLKDKNGNIQNNNVIYNQKIETAITKSKTAHVSDWNDRTYEITLNASSVAQSVSSYEPVDIVLAFDVSGSMLFPSSLKYVGEGTPNQILKDDKQTYYWIDEPSGKATVYKVWRQNGMWVYRDASYTTGETAQLGSASRTFYISDDNDESGNPKTRLSYLKSSATTFVNKVAEVSPNTKISLVTFAKESDVIVTLGEALSTNKETLIEKIDGLTTTGGTNQKEALKDAKKQLDKTESEGRKQYVVLLTDGSPNADGCDKTTITNAANDITSDSNRTLITVGVNLDQIIETKELMEDIASEKNGAKLAFNAASGDQLSGIMESIFQTIMENIPVTDATIKDYIDPRFEVDKDSVTAVGGTVGTDANGTYVIWENITIPAASASGAAGWSRTFTIKAKENYIGGNNVTTNKEPSGITVQDTFLEFKSPVVNVKAELEVGNYETTIFKGDTVAVDSQNIIDQLFDVDEIIAKYNNTADPLKESELLLKWYKDTSCTEEVTNEELQKALINPDSDTIYYLKVTFTGAGNSSDESRSNTDEHIAGYDDGVEDTIVTAKNKNATKYPNTYYGVYSVKVISGSIDITKKLDQPAQGEKTFNFTINGPDGFSKQVSITIQAGATIGSLSTENKESLKNLPRGSYTVTETEVEGYTIKEINTDSSNCKVDETDQGVTFTLGTFVENGEDKDTIAAKEYTKGIFGKVEFINRELSAYITVNKTFKGLTWTQIKNIENVFELKVENVNDSTVIKTLKLNQADDIPEVEAGKENVVQDYTFTWIVEGCGTGNYKVTENGEDISGYQVSTSGLGDEVTVSEETWQFGTDVEDKTQTITQNSQTEFTIGDNKIVMASLTGNGPKYMIWTNERLTSAQQATVIYAINNDSKYATFKVKAATVDNCLFYYGDALTNGISVGKGSISYIPLTVGEERSGVLKFDATNVWQHVYLGTYTIKNAVNADIGVTNTYTTSLDLKKVSSSTGNAISDAKFKLFKLEDGDWKVVKNEIIVNNNDGTAPELTDLEPGVLYQLEETEAPSGYALLDENIYFKVSNNNVDFCKKDGTPYEKIPTMWEAKLINGSMVLTIKNTVLYDLPSAGGSGIFWYLISGTAFLMAASLILYRMKRKEVLGK